MKLVLPYVISCWFALAPLHADNWPQYQHNPAHTGRTDAAVTPEALHLIWSAPGYTEPVVQGDTVYATSGTTLTAFVARTGEVKWSYSMSNSFPVHAAVTGKVAALIGFNVTAYSNILVILDASTGIPHYTVSVGGSFDLTPPTLARDPVSGLMTAYCATSSVVTAVQLGSNSATVLWSQSGGFGGFSTTTIAGNSIVVAGPGQYYAFDRTTGEVNHFHDGDIEGGGGTTVTYDSTLSQLYVLEAYDSTTFGALTAYRYTDNKDISRIWQLTNPIDLDEAGSVAIGADGKIYYCTPSQMAEVDPSTGAVLRSVNTNFATAVTPALTQGVVWVFNQTQTLSYDLTTFTVIQALNDSRGDLNTPYCSPGAFKDEFFVLNGSGQLEVYRGRTN